MIKFKDQNMFTVMLLYLLAPLVIIRYELVLGHWHVVFPFECNNNIGLHLKTYSDTGLLCDFDTKFIDIY